MSKLQSIKNSVIKTLIRVVLYLRLSDEDRDKLTKFYFVNSLKYFLLKIFFNSCFVGLGIDVINSSL